MKVFRFRLQTSLDVRCRQEESQKQELLQKISCLEQSKILLNTYIARQNQLYEDIRHAQQGALDVQKLVSCQNYVIVVKEQIVKQKKAVESCRRAVDEAREKLIEIIKARKILEKLKEKHFQAYRLEAEREEQKAIDEMAARRIAR